MTLASSTGKGIFLTSGVLYFTRAARIPAQEVGIGLSAAGIASVVAGICAGYLSDRRGPRAVLMGSLLLGALATAAFLPVHGFWAFLLVVVAATSAQSSLLVARGPIINHLAEGRPQELRAYIRSVTNIGISVGAALAGWAAQADTVGTYRQLVLVNCGCFLAAAALAFRIPRMAPIRQTTEGPRWTALRDRPYLTLALLDGVLSIQYRVLTVAVPLWIVGATSAPRWAVSAAVVLNTVIVILFQVRASRRVDSLRAAALTLRRSGCAFLLACAAMAWASGIPPTAALVVLGAAVAVHSVGELWQAAGGFEVSNVLAPEHALGQYLGVFGVGMGLAESFGPALLTWLCIGWGKPGWFVLGALFLAAGLGAPRAVRWAEATRGLYTPQDELGAAPQTPRVPAG
ncbi:MULTISPECIES: MFS transporter [Streptacidiphilus]|uniref:MFS transporter n=1 Tax=Streptacidiphilus cavernicola TaxID=3342716 RepID=A0ABV6UXF2_9ACTN|nr:MFS transporter [Streptacidiphilus jeojiense]